jgi:class 3 adenylate cyclase
VSSREDELRPVTILFADVVGSTALGEKLPPDEVKALIGECVNQMSRAVREYGGTVQAYMGDGICAYFGVPVAREDDPERSARAALRILDVVRTYARDVEAAWGIDHFDVRVGIDSGMAAVGPLSTDESQMVAFGDAGNVAARLQGLAMPGTIAVGEAAAGRLGDRFVLEPVGRMAVRGREDEVDVHRLVSPRRHETEPRQGQRSQLVGRERELLILRVAVGELKQGRGQVLLVSGEAGIGKTRLLEELRSLAGADVSWLEGHFLSYGGPPSWAFEEILRNQLGLADGEPEIATRAKARAKLGALLGDDLDDALGPLGRLLRVRLDPNAESSGVGPESSPRAYAAWISALAAQQPVVVALEDLHWATPDSRELADAVLELTDRAAVLVVATLRPDAASEGRRFRMRALGDFAHRTAELRLAPLDDQEATDLVRSLGGDRIDDATTAAVVARADGNPSFAEELVGLLLEGGRLERRRTWTLTLGEPALPARLENLLVARIDALPDGAGRLAQIAAVIGRRFDVPLLERVAGGESFEADLLALVRSEIIREVRRYPELVCEFRHGLLHEAALSTLTPARHRDLAGRIGAALETQLGERSNGEAERLAQYYLRSDRLDKALAYLEHAAAQDGVERTHAAELLSAGRRAAARLGDAEAERRLETRLRELET